MRGEYVKSPISRIRVAISASVLAVAVAGSAVAVAGSAVAATDAKRHPFVAVANEAPVVVTGRGFVARERIRLRLAIGSRVFAKGVRATAAGTFRAAFAETDAQCQPYSITAVGGFGSRATQTRRFNIPPPCGVEPQP